MSDAGDPPDEPIESDDVAAFDPDEWREQLESYRQEKDEFFAEHPQSPIPPDDRDDFEGLDYFAPDPKYRVAATVEVHDQPEPVEMDVSSGPPQRYLRVVTLHFELDGEARRASEESSGERSGPRDDEAYDLAGYQQEGEDGLLVPFRDKTTGQQTYEGGRYMEFEPEGELEDGGELILDFNLAYSPFCAYSEAFACPLPPEENWLETTIRAGEKA